MAPSSRLSRLTLTLSKVINVFPTTRFYDDAASGPSLTSLPLSWSSPPPLPRNTSQAITLNQFPSLPRLPGRPAQRALAEAGTQTHLTAAAAATLFL